MINLCIKNIYKDGLYSLLIEKEGFYYEDDTHR